MEMQSYSEFSRRIHEQVNPRRIPVNGTIEISNRCPLNCSHCYNNLPMNDLTARNAELTLEEHCRILDELADAGCLWMLFSGGEIFARHDFLDIYDHAKRRGFLITLFTNGILIDERIADHLAVMRPFAIEITLYGATRETYETLTRIPGSYEKCLRGIRLLRERNLPLKLKTVAVTVNKHEIFAMKELAEEMGVEFTFDGMINPRIDCSSSPLSMRLSPADLVELDLRDPSRAEEWRRLTTELAPPPLVPGEAVQLYECGGGVNSFAIDPYGNLTICVLSHVDMYNLRNGSFLDGWDGYLHAVRQKTASPVPTKCTSCNLRTMCGMCPANGELESGDPEAPVDFLCQVAHLRAATYDVPVPPHGDCEYCPDGSRHHELLAMSSDVQNRIASGPELTPVAMFPASTGCSSGGCTSCSVGR
jgi:radical SAM protein with 4Fe4S-binding SPASM domain